MEKPTDVSGLQRLIGMVKYLGKYQNSLSDICEPLRRLTHKNAVWNWAKEHDKAFQDTKNAVTKTPVLKFFEPNMPLEGQRDASSKGLGFVLLQEDRPVTYSSRALTSAEQNYSQIEKELLAQVFGMEQNHQYVYGRQVTLWTDHQPFVSIAMKPLASTPKRLQRLLLQLQNYDVKICYKPGKEMVLADTLSRASLSSHNGNRSETEKDTEVVHMANHLAISDQQLQYIQQATSNDETLKDVMRIIVAGWPEKKDSLNASLHPYFHIRDELATQDGIVFKGPRAVIPVHLRKKIREKLHAAHTGVQSCLQRACEVVYWPGMNKDLTDCIAKCDICNSFHNNQEKEPLLTREIPK